MKAINEHRRSPLDPVRNGEGPYEQTVLTLPGGAALGVRVHHDGWCAVYDGKHCALADIPSIYHSTIKAAVKGVAYDAGYFTYRTPPGPTGLWDRIDWIDYVTFDFPI